MFRKLMTIALVASLISLPLAIGCGGPGEATTIDASERQGLDTHGKDSGERDPTGKDLPDGLQEV